MERIKSWVTVQRAVIGSVVVLLIMGLMLGLSMNRGPSDEARRAYELACEAIRAQLPEDQRETATFPEAGDDKVEILIPIADVIIYSFVTTKHGRRDWYAMITPYKVDARFTCSSDCGVQGETAGALGLDGEVQ